MRIMMMITSPRSPIHLSCRCRWRTRVCLMRIGVHVVLWCGVGSMRDWRQRQIERNVVIAGRPPQHLRHVCLRESSWLIMMMVTMIKLMMLITVFNWRTQKTRQEPATHIHSLHFRPLIVYILSYCITPARGKNEKNVFWGKTVIFPHEYECMITKGLSLFAVDFIVWLDACNIFYYKMNNNLPAITAGMSDESSTDSPNNSTSHYHIFDHSVFGSYWRW